VAVLFAVLHEWEVQRPDICNV